MTAMVCLCNRSGSYALYSHFNGAIFFFNIQSRAMEKTSRADPMSSGEEASSLAGKLGAKPLVS